MGVLEDAIEVGILWIFRDFRSGVAVLLRWRVAEPISLLLYSLYLYLSLRFVGLYLFVYVVWREGLIRLPRFLRPAERLKFRLDELVEVSVASFVLILEHFSTCSQLYLPSELLEFHFQFSIFHFFGA